MAKVKHDQTTVTNGFFFYFLFTEECMSGLTHKPLY